MKKVMLILGLFLCATFAADGENNTYAKVLKVYFQGRSHGYALSVFVDPVEEGKNNEWFLLDKTHPNFDGIAAAMLSVAGTESLVEFYHYEDRVVSDTETWKVIYTAGIAEKK